MMTFCSNVLFSSLRQVQRSSIKVKDEHFLFSRTKNKEHKKKTKMLPIVNVSMIMKRLKNNVNSMALLSLETAIDDVAFLRSIQHSKRYKFFVR